MCPSTQEGRAKSKRRLAIHSTAFPDDSTPNIAHGHQGSMEKIKSSLKIRPPPPPLDPGSSQPTPRHGSDALVSSREMHGASCTQPSSGRNSEGTTIAVPSSVGERTRHRFSLSSMKYWRSSSRRTTSQTSSPLDTSSVGSSLGKAPQQSASTDVNITLRRSEEVLRRHGRECMPSGTHDPCEGGLTAARRASSWGDPMNYAEEVTSLTSGEHDGLDEDALFLGAGGVCNDPSTLVSNSSIGFSHVADGALRHPQPERLHIEPGIGVRRVSHESLSHCDASAGTTTTPGSGPSSSQSRQSQLRSATTSPSPLHQVAYESGVDQASGGDDYDDDLASDSDSSFFRDRHQEREEQAALLRSRVNRLYLDDEDDEDDEDAPIEVRRRRPLVSVTATSAPPPASEFSDEQNSRSR
ncbi:hypothetical protein EDC04DRAFT_240088 [Pisolithus marmoratus]|nr:hypothetical protein EDC04DRAFT_240088 [Pisolithus marmoratus]